MPARARTCYWPWLRLACAVIAGSACSGDANSGSPDAQEHAHGDAAHDHEHAGARGREPTDAAVAQPDASVGEGFEWQLPAGFPRPHVPADNPMTLEKVELGRHLFYDKRLSDNETFSCASCHEQRLAFSDGRAKGLGSTGESHTRSSMSLTNVAYAATLTWANPHTKDLESQAETPIFGADPIELGVRSAEALEERLRVVPRYRQLFAAAFPDEAEPIRMQNVARALATFQRTLISGNSAYDRYFNSGDESALSESAKRGMVFVTTNDDHRFECNHCHGGFNFSDHTVYEGATDAAPLYHQTGLYNLDGRGSYPAPNTGVHHFTQRPEDMGQFKAPSLRNIALTAPYMHDGSIASLSEVLDHYARGGRARVSGKTDSLLAPFTMTEQEKLDIIAFLESLTDTEFTTTPRFADPWLDEPTQRSMP